MYFFEWLYFNERVFIVSLIEEMLRNDLKRIILDKKYSLYFLCIKKVISIFFVLGEFENC